MKRYEDVLALIKESAERCEEVKRLYDKALRDGSTES